jgi:hypothetical protein
MRHLIELYKARRDEAGRLARLLDAEMGGRWVFLLEKGGCGEVCIIIGLR